MTANSLFLFLAFSLRFLELALSYQVASGEMRFLELALSYRVASGEMRFLELALRVPYTFCVKRDWGYFFPVKRDFELLLIRDS